MSQETMKQINETIDYIRQHSKITPLAGITLGSGLSFFADQIQVDCRIPYTKLPHFVPPSVEGHPGQLVLGYVDDIPVAVLQGRIHYYEGHTMQEVAFPTRVLAALGINVLLLTNSAGGMHPSMQPGDFMLINDHINLTGDNPLRGANVSQLGPRFVDMSQRYDVQLRNTFAHIMKTHKVRYFEGVYCGVAGPTYESPAEIQYLQKIGGSAVGMSTVPEAIAAAHAGVRLCGVSCITNRAAGLSATPITHDEVKQAAKQVEEKFVALIQEFIRTADLNPSQ